MGHSNSSEHALVARVKALHNRLAVKSLTDRGKELSPKNFGLEKRNGTVSIVQIQIDKKRIGIVTTTSSKYYKYLVNEGHHLLIPGEILGSPPTLVYGPKESGKSPKRQSVHAEQLGVNDARSMGAKRGVMATSNLGCKEQCVALIREEFPTFTHLNPKEKHALSQQDLENLLGRPKLGPKQSAAGKGLKNQTEPTRYVENAEPGIRGRRMGRPPDRRPSWLVSDDGRKLVDDTGAILDRRRSSKPFKPSAEKTKLTEAVGEFGARSWARHKAGSGVTVVQVPKRADGVGVLDDLFRTDDNRYIVVEAKGGNSKLGMTRQGTVSQFSPQWFSDRIDELRSLGHGNLADELHSAWREGRIEAYEVYVDTEATAIGISEKRRLEARRAYVNDPATGKNLGKGRRGKRAGRVRKTVDRTAEWKAFIDERFPPGAADPPGRPAARTRAGANTAVPDPASPEIGRRQTRLPEAPAPARFSAQADQIADAVTDTASVRKGASVARAAKALGSLIAGQIVDYAIGAIVADYERQIAEIERPRIARAWKEEIYPVFADKMQAYVLLQPHVPASGHIKGHTGLGKRQYLHVRWETMSRLQTEDVISDTAVWIVKFYTGDPGFVKFLEDVRHVEHRLTSVDEPRTRPRRYYDRNDEWLLHEEHDAFILVWSAKVSRLTNAYHATRHLCWQYIDWIEQQMEFEIADLPINRKTEIRKFLITEALGKVHAAVTVHDYRGAQKALSSIRHTLNGQFNYAGLAQYRIDRVRALMDQLRGAVASRPRERMRALDEDERALLGAFLQQDSEHL